MQLKTSIQNNGRIYRNQEKKIELCESNDLIYKCISLIKNLLNKLKPKSKILIIAGSVQLEYKQIKTVTALGGYAMTAITVCSQNTTT